MLIDFKPKEWVLGVSFLIKDSENDPCQSDNGRDQNSWASPRVLVPTPTQADEE
jgi:hypothetical protein